MAKTAAAPFSTRPNRAQMLRVRALVSAAERWLEAERDQLPLWIPVMLGCGVATWLTLGDARHWMIAILASLAIGLAALAGGRSGRLLRVVAIGALLFAVGVALIWWRADRVAAPVLARPAVVTVTGRVERAEPLAARGLVRVVLVTETAGVPPRVRINLADEDVPAGLGRGARISLRARLMPPPAPSVPGAYDFERVAWFAGLGATGRGFAPVTVITPARARSDLRV
ncbi:MAG: DUF4131 domain-containing protein, partial [Sphingomonas bacterium]|nr:DUF4131 domain-containing protein [Sphingomonas bacterium]